MYANSQQTIWGTVIAALKQHLGQMKGQRLLAKLADEMLAEISTFREAFLSEGQKCYSSKRLALVKVCSEMLVATDLYCTVFECKFLGQTTAFYSEIAQTKLG